MQSQEIIQFYDNFAENYDEVVLKEKDYTAFERIPSWILDKLVEPSLILDLGCGTGLGSRPFLKNHHLTGIDISPKMVESAAKLPFSQLLCQSLEEALPFAGGNFEAAQMLGVMEFIANPSKLFKEVHRVLKKKGLFALTIPMKLDADLEKELGIKTYHLSEMEQLFQKCGFVTLRQEKFQGFQYLGKTVFYCGYLLSAI